MTRSPTFALVLTLGLTACGASTAPAPSTAWPSPTTVVVTAGDPVRVAHLAAAVAAIEAYSHAIGAVTRKNLRIAAPQLAAAHQGFAAQLAAVAVDPSFDPTRLAAWRALAAAMTAVEAAAVKGDAKAFLKADQALIAASGAAG